VSGQAASARSPARRALRRFLGDYAAVSGVIALVAIALLCLFVPWLWPNPYDQVYRDYVKTPPSLAAHPNDDETSRVVGRLARQIGGAVLNFSVERGVLKVTLDAPGAGSAEVVGPLSGPFAAPATFRRDDNGRLRVEVPLRPQAFPLGTDSNGRDLLARVFVGGRVSLLVGALASLVALAIGVSYGAVAGYFGGRIDAAMMRLVDILYALPFIFFVILIIVVLGRHFVFVFVAIGAVEWLDMARIVRGQALSLRRQDYVLAAESLGVGPFAILQRHIVPNLIGPVIAYLSLVAARVILLESFLSFLGLGVQEPMTSLGALIADGARNIEDSPGLLIFPGLLLSLLLLALSLIGEGLIAAINPQARR
jgi:oligopeptide transport system permease protein